MLLVGMTPIYSIGQCSQDNCSHSPEIHGNNYNSTPTTCCKTTCCTYTWCTHPTCFAKSQPIQHYKTLSNVMGMQPLLTSYSCFIDFLLSSLLLINNNSNNKLDSDSLLELFQGELTHNPKFRLTGLLNLATIMYLIISKNKDQLFQCSV